MSINRYLQAFCEEWNRRRASNRDALVAKLTNDVMCDSLDRLIQGIEQFLADMKAIDETAESGKED